MNRVSGFGFWLSGFGFRVSGFGFFGGFRADCIFTGFREWAVFGLWGYTSSKSTTEASFGSPPPSFPVRSCATPPPCRNTRRLRGSLSRGGPHAGSGGGVRVRVRVRAREYPPDEGRVTLHTGVTSHPRGGVPLINPRGFGRWA